MISLPLLIYDDNLMSVESEEQSVGEPQWNSKGHSFGRPCRKLSSTGMSSGAGRESTMSASFVLSNESLASDAARKSEGREIEAVGDMPRC